MCEVAGGREADNSRRAKIKLLAKKSIETGEDCDSIPESMRQYLAIQAMESGKPLAGGFLNRPGMMPYGSGPMVAEGEQGPQEKVGTYSPLHHAVLSCSAANLSQSLATWSVDRCRSDRGCASPRMRWT
jgi:hypothetical protein